MNGGTNHQKWNVKPPAVESYEFAVIFRALPEILEHFFLVKLFEANAVLFELFDFLVRSLERNYPF